MKVKQVYLLSVSFGMLLIGIVWSGLQIANADPNNTWEDGSGSIIYYDDGYVGIGDSTPDFTLDVNSGTTNRVARFTSTNEKGTIVLKDDSSTSYITSIHHDASDVDYLSMGGVNDYSADNLNINLDNGYVGIGTTTPDTELDVAGLIQSSSASGGKLSSLNPDNQSAILSLMWDTNDPIIMIEGSGTGTARGLGIQKYNGDSLLKITNGGNLEWGTYSYLRNDQGGAIELRGDSTTPYIDFSNYPDDNIVDYDARFILTDDDTLKLVGATLQAEEVLVTSSGADYVFSEEYDLMSLSDVENYISQNNHLPGIPSAEEVQTDGLSVGEMQTKLLEKVEELTLHMIELEKENQSLRSELESLRLEINK